MDVIEVEKRDEDTKTGVYPGAQGTRHGERLANSVRRREKGEPTKTLYSRGHPGAIADCFGDHSQRARSGRRPAAPEGFARWLQKAAQYLGGWLGRTPGGVGDPDRHDAVHHRSPWSARRVTKTVVVAVLVGLLVVRALFAARSFLINYGLCGFDDVEHQIRLARLPCWRPCC
jgi:hypothetical protein